MAGQSLYRYAAGRASTRRAGGPNKPFGLFDVDSRELSKAGDGLDFRPRVAPLVDRLKRLYALAEQHSAPLVFTTCCSGRMLRPDSLAEVLFVPLDAAQREWAGRLGDHRLYYVQKKTYHDAQANFGCHAYDMFGDNGNAGPGADPRRGRVGRVRQWLRLVHHLRRPWPAGRRSEGVPAVGRFRGAHEGISVPTAKGRVECGIPENLARVLAEFRQAGVRTATLEEFLASAAKTNA